MIKRQNKTLKSYLKVKNFYSKNIFTLAILLSFHNVSWSDEQRDGNYNVPVESEELVNSSDFQTKYKFRSQNGKITRVKYKLPIELTGTENNVDISYTGDTENPWSGDNAKGDCQEINNNFNCNLIYTKELLNIDANLSEAAIRNTFAGNEDEIQRRLKVAEVFRSEPAGITTFNITTER